MLFHSDLFLFEFLPITFIVFLILRRLTPGAVTPWLLAASLVFYGWEDPFRLLPLIGWSITLNLLIGRYLFCNPKQWVLWTGVAANLALLGVFKYADFVLSLVADMSGWEPHKIGIALPAGISFYTFTQIAFLVDAYRGETQAPQPMRYGLFVTFFPHLIAGPIIYHKATIPQFDWSTRAGKVWQNVVIGLSLFCFGLFKKVMLADGIQPFVAYAFAGGATPDLIAAWTGALAFTFQLYFDFSGYSDMAIGLARAFGVVFPANFDSPYKSTSIIDFWRRWNMTLSRFLRDYLYIPLGGNRTGLGRYPNLLIVMALGGLWHGAGLTYLLWGTLHGLFLIINHIWAQVAPLRKNAGSTWVGVILARALTFVAVVVGWVIFRAETVPQAMTVLRGMIGLAGIGSWSSIGCNPGAKATMCLAGTPAALWWIVCLSILVFLCPNTQEMMSDWRPVLGEVKRPLGIMRILVFRPNPFWAAIAATLCAISVSNIGQSIPFLYYQF